MRDLKLVKCGIVYGANATGKSNLLKAFQFMQQFCLNFFQRKFGKSRNRYTTVSFNQESAFIPKFI
ncbi:AAA family ATPase [Mucilaginibacter sp. P25]|uniref:AAA family ATPase n=1 Tax=Mucilaginibacter sp. P25 TaxID=3423945 RepID=UPI003D78C993